MLERQSGCTALCCCEHLHVLRSSACHYVKLADESCREVSSLHSLQLPYE
jgi:hypothetical protein